MCEYCKTKANNKPLIIEKQSYMDYNYDYINVEVAIGFGDLYIGNDRELDCHMSLEKIKINFCPMCGDKIRR